MLVGAGHARPAAFRQAVVCRTPPRGVEDAAPYRTSRQVCRGRIYAARSLLAVSRLPYTSRGAVKTAPYKAPITGRPVGRGLDPSVALGVYCNF